MLYELYNILASNDSMNLFGYLSFRSVAAFVTALLISFFIGPKIIRTLKNHHIGEMIRKNGPDSHLQKEGTPTMGGVIILLSVILPTILWSDIFNDYIQIILISTIVMGLVGLLDDYLKVVKKYPKGLIAKYKLFAQVCLGIFVGLMIMWGGNSGNYFYEGKTELSKLFSKDAEEALTPKDFQERREQSYGFMQRFLSVKNIIENRFDYSASEISIPFLADKRLSEFKKIEQRLIDSDIYPFEGFVGSEWEYQEKFKRFMRSVDSEGLMGSVPSGSIEVGAFLILLSILVIAGSSNAINLTDGIDGLAGGLSAIVFFALGLISYASGNINISSYLNITYIHNAGEITVFCMAMVGACLGFLWYNTNPAEIFMGDTGSLSLGAAMGAIAIILKKEILLILIAGVFVVEALSVIMQVSFFKYTRFKYGKAKRLFLMAPLHHHYELKGMKESKIVVRFWIIGVLLTLIALITLKVQ